MFYFLVIERLTQATPEPAPAPVVYDVTGVIACLIYVLLVLGVSALTYRFVEVPARRWLSVRLGVTPQMPIAVR